MVTVMGLAMVLEQEMALAKALEQEKVLVQGWVLG
jgi:hypothetical protein